MKAVRWIACLVFTTGMIIFPAGYALSGGGCHVDGTIGTDTYLWECGNGDDVLNSGPQNDHVAFQGGNDVGNLDGGSDSADGGSGNDLIRGQGGDDTRLRGNSGNDRIVGGAGVDTILENDTGGDTDRICDGDGRDHLNVDDGDGLDTIYLKPDGVTEAAVHIDSGDDIINGDCPFST